MRDLVLVRNPFDRSQREVIPLKEGATVGALVGEYIPAGVDVNVSINGHLLKREAWATFELSPRDQMVVVPSVQGDGNGLLGSVLMIALMVAAPQIAFAAYSAAGGTMAAAAFAASAGGMIMTAGVGLLGSMVIGSLMAPAKPSLPGASSYDTSPAYAWAPVTTQQPGGPIARAYGLFKLYGNIIAGYIENTGDTGSEQTAHILVDLGQGPYEQLYDFKINDQPISLYSGVKVTERLGLLTQDIVPSFNDTRANSTFAAGKIVNGTPVTRSTTGTQFSALEVVLTCPGGLWYANDSGGLDAHSIDLKVEMSVNGAAWVTAIQSAQTVTLTTSGYWSAGYWVDGSSGDPWAPKVWSETTAGSSTTTDHTEGEDAGAVAGTAYFAFWHWISSPVVTTATTKDFIRLSDSSQKPIRKTIRIDGLVPGDSCQIRATNLSTDYSTNSRYGDSVYLAEINEVILDDFTYPRAVLAGIDALATNQLSGAIKFSCLSKAAKVWVGGSTGAFAWSQNPAWVAYDILTQPVTNDAGTTVLRYDGFNPSRIDLQSFTDWAAFCDVSVADGNGGTEPRCQFDGVFDTETDMWTAALDVAATARATLVTRGTTIAAVYDDVRATPVQIFTVANSSGFTEDFLKMEGRASVIEVDFTNRDLDYGRDIVPIINDVVAAASPGSPPASAALRITRSSQAWREANYRLAKNQYLQRFANLSVDIDSIGCTVGDRVDIQADVPEWGEGGRAVSGNTTSITLDHPVTLAAATTYEITVRHSGTTDAIEKRTISTGAGTVSVVSVSSAFSVAVAQYDVWAIGIANASTKPFIVTDFTKDSNQRMMLSLIEYNASIYGLDSGIPAIPTPDVSASIGFGNITGVTASEQLSVAADGTASTVVTLHWGFSDRSKVRATQVIAQPTGTFTYGQTPKQVRSVTDSAQFVGIEDGATYIFTLVSENYLGQTQPLSAGATLTYGVIGRTATTFDTGKAGPPATPTALTATGGLFTIGLAWSVDVGTRKDIAYTEVWASNTNDRAAAARITCAPWPEASYKHIGLAPAQQWYYWVRLEDTSGNVSGWYPAGATAGVSGVPSADPSALLTQLQDAVGMPQLAADLAAPIALVTAPANLAAIAWPTAPANPTAPLSPIVVQAQAAAEAALRLLLKVDESKQRAITEKWISDATITLDKVAGTVTLLATAAISTDVDARLNSVDITLGAQAGSIVAHTASLADHSGRITSAETEIASLNGAITLKASTSYVDTTIAGALGVLDPAEIQANQDAGAIGLLHALLDADAGRVLAQSSVARLATAERSLTTNADAISAEAAERLILAAQVDSTLAALVLEESTRATADAAEAVARTTLAATMTATYGSTAAAATSAAAALVSETNAGSSATSATNSANTATSQAGTATTQAGIATTQAGNAATSASAAAASASSASTQATNAGSSATSATNSANTATSGAGTATTQAGIATTQAGIAATQAGNAATSAAAAAASASSASTSQTDAASSATAASGSSTSASTSAGTATTQAGIAATQASNASTSAGNSSTSASNAATSAAAASTSASAASASATAASTSASNASTSAGAASTSASDAAGYAAASAVDYSTVVARLDTGDYAAVKTESSANASAIAGVEAEWGVQVQTMADGVRAMAGITLLAGTDGETVFAVLANKLLIYKPDGTGTPKQIVTLGTVNGVATLGLLGDLIVDGSVTTRTIAANNITVPWSAYTPGPISLSHTSGPVTALTLVVLGSGVPMKINCSITVAGVTSGNPAPWYLNIKKGTAVIGGSATHVHGTAGPSSMSLSVSDTPGSLAYTTYTMELYGNGTDDANAYSASMEMLEVKK